MQKIRIVTGANIQHLEDSMNNAIDDMREENMFLTSWDYVPEMNAVVMAFSQEMED